MKFGLRGLAGAGVIVAIALLAGLMLARSTRDRESDDGRSALRTDSLIVHIAEDGLYRLSLEALQDAGLTLTHLDPSSLRLSQGKHLVPTHIAGETLIFYGRAPVNRYEATRSYLLELDQAGQQMASVDRPPGDGLDLPTATFRRRLEENNFYDGRPYDGQTTDPGLRDPWFWETIQIGGQATIDFVLPEMVSGPAELKLNLIGVGENPNVTEDHDIDLVLNGILLGTLRWDGETVFSPQATLPEDLLRSGQNTLVLDNSAPGSAPVDIMRLDWLELSYEAAPIAAGDQLNVTGVEGNLALTGFSDSPLLFDVSDPDKPKLLTGSESADGSSRIRLEDGIHLYGVGPKGFLTPSALLARRPATLTNPTNQADLIIIAPSSLTSALDPLIKHRQSQGLSAMVVPLEQILDEFTAHGSGPAAVNAFVTYAFDNWVEPRPSYLLLVGDATYDYRDYLGHEQENLLPSPMVNVTYSGETTSDARLADVDGDLRPDLAVGRWPVSGPTEVAELVKRTLDYERAAVSPQALFAADGTEMQFANLNKAVVDESGLALGHTLHLDGPTTQELREAWEQGAWLVTYAGHGSPDRWGKDNVLSSEDVPDLETDFAVPIVLQLTCLTGLFAHPTIVSLSEEMLLDESGPIALVAATSLSLSSHQRPFGAAFIEALQDSGKERIGDAFQQAKHQLDVESNDAMREISDTFTLFGDPSALIRRPAGG